MNTLAQLLGRERPEIRERLERQVIRHDAIDELRYEDLIEDSKTFRERTVEDCPTVVAKPAPEPVDTLTATADEIEAYREAVMEYRAAEREAKPYTSWAPLIADVFYSYYTRSEPQILERVDVGVELHRKIMEQVLASEEHQEARDLTAGDDILSAYATMKFVDKLKHVLGHELEERMREAQELEERRKEIEDIEVEIDEILPPDPGPVGQQPEGELPQPPEGEGPPGPGGTPEGEGPPGPVGGTPVGVAPGGNGGQPAGPQPKIKLSEKAKQELQELEDRKREAEADANAKAEPKPLDGGAQGGIEGAAKAGRDAAEQGSLRPKWGGGIGTGAGEPTYTSPEQALALMEEWINNPELREMCALMGGAIRDFRYKRRRRIEHGNDEIVDVKQGDDLRRVLPSELALLAEPSLEDDFFARYVDRELLEYKTEGQEHAGRGPVAIVLDGSGSMHGERNIYARAVALTVLQNTRIEKRDFALIEFSAGNQVQEWIFRSREALEGEKVLDMASHFFGGGTVPIIGVERAAALMRSAPAFRKADIVIVGDGDGAWSADDEKLRDELKGMGVRFFGIAIGGSWEYIKKYCDYVVDVHDFQLQEPGQAVSDLAERMS